MQFVAAVLFLLFFHQMAALQAIGRGARWLGVAHFLVAFAAALAGMNGLVGLPLLPPFRPYQLGGPNPAVWLLALLVVGTLPLAFVRLVRLQLAGGDRSRFYWRQGVTVWSFLAGLYIAVCLVDHFVFFAKGMTGVADAQGLGVTDVRCADGVVVRIEPNLPARYRCAHSLVWGALTDTPLVPWPSYDEGLSVQLGPAIEAVSARAKAGAHAGG